MDPEIALKINQAKIDMMHPTRGLVFFSSLLSYLKIEIDPTCGTAWTDAISIGLDPTLVMRATIPELIGVFMHELGHVIYDHIPICMENEWILKKDHNIAGDHYINLENAKNGFVLPHWIDPYQDPKYIGWSTMQIYADIQKNPPPDKPNGMGMDIRMPPGMPTGEFKERVISNIIKATMEAEKADAYGSVPGSIQRFVKEVVSPKLPWPMILQNRLTSYSKDDYTMSKPNRKYMPEFYLPSLYSESMGGAIAALDCSGSITSDELNTGMAETSYMFDTMKPTTLRLISFDTKIHLNKVFSEGDTLPTDIDLMGGGGTNVLPILKYVREEEPMLCLIFTDGGFQMPNLEDITSDIIWIIKGCPNFNPPHGDVIHMEDYS
jgi:predicted metal-dependent peptidase